MKRKAIASRAYKALPQDVLRKIFLQYHSQFWSNPVNKLVVKQEFYNLRGVRGQSVNQFCVRLGGPTPLSSPEYMITSESNGVTKKVMVVAKPLDTAGLDTLLNVVMHGGSRQWRSTYRFTSLMVAAGAVQGEFGYETAILDPRGRKMPNVMGPRAYVRRLLLRWLRLNDVPIRKDVWILDCIQGRNNGLHETLPMHMYFK